MATPKALVLRAAGTNCDAETAHAFELCGARADIVPLVPFLADPGMLAGYQVLAVPGGFSYGDDILAGRVLAVELCARAGPELLALVERGGVILGICNGFQVLVQMGLLPGIEQPLGGLEASLARNDVNVYQDRWVHLEVTGTHCALLRGIERLYLPVAHAEGKLVPRDAPMLARMHTLGRIALRYVGPDGEREPPFPANPNGSVDAIAGLTDKSGRVLGLMPHPERHLYPYQHPTWTRTGLAEEPDGRRIFANAVRVVQ